VNDPAVLVHVAWPWQVLGYSESTHSSQSTQLVPSVEAESSSNPKSHSHVNDPHVLLQVASESQLATIDPPVPPTHSSTSSHTQSSNTPPM